MYHLSESELEYILNDIKKKGVTNEALQQDLLDHVCCMIEQGLSEGGDFKNYYQVTITSFYTNHLKEIEEEAELLIKFKNYYTMKKIMIVSGIFSASSFLIGSLFKIMHWPGASILLVLAIAFFSFLFLPLIGIFKGKEATTGSERTIIMLGSLLGVSYCMSVLFTIMHWPGSPALWLFTIGFSIFIFIPAYSLNGLSNPEKRINTIIASVIILVATGLHFAMINLRPVSPEIKMYSYVDNESLLQRMKQVPSRSLNQNLERTTLASEINQTCKQIKALILQSDIGQPELPLGFDSLNILIVERNAGSDFHENGKGRQLMEELKVTIGKYNNISGISSNQVIPIKHSILSIDFKELGRYSNLFLLNSITQVQMFLANEKATAVASINQ